MHHLHQRETYPRERCATAINEKPCLFTPLTLVASRNNNSYTKNILHPPINFTRLCCTPITETPKRTLIAYRSDPMPPEKYNSLCFRSRLPTYNTRSNCTNLWKLCLKFGWYLQHKKAYWSLLTSSVLLLGLDFQKDHFGLIFGWSGSGKTTLLQLIAGLSKPTSGSIYVQRYSDDGEQIKSPEPLQAERVGIVFHFLERFSYLGWVFHALSRCSLRFNAILMSRFM